jgi:glutamyl/glutaminyl-tRNA synthetase
MLSIVNYPERGSDGRNNYRGNCSGKLIEDLINQYKVKEITEAVGFTTDMKAYKADPSAFPGTVADISTFIRQATTGKTNSPDLYTVMQILGAERACQRIRNVINTL